MTLTTVGCTDQHHTSTLLYLNNRKFLFFFFLKVTCIAKKNSDDAIIREMKELKRMITKKVNVQGRFYMQHDHEILVMQYI